MRIEVAYAGPQGQWLVALEVAEGTTLAQAIGLSGIREQLPQLHVSDGNVGVFSQLRPLNSVLRDGDRVEIYRPLLVDPKESRRRRAGKRTT